jgi:phosphatidylserine synthase
MHMTGSNGVLSVPSEHLPGLVALVALIPALWLALCGLRALASHGSSRADNLLRRFDGLTFTAKAVLFASLVGAVVHAAIVPTHWGGSRVTAILFIADTLGFGLVFWLTFNGRPHWRAASVAVLAGTVGAYALYVVRGWETMDLVGLVTTTIELAAALVVLSPVGSPSGSRRRERWLALSAVPLAAVTLVGTATIAGTAGATAAVLSSPTHQGKPAMSSMPASPSMPPSMSSTGATSPLSLATTSAAGPIIWPDDMSAMAPGMAMATPDCTAQPTAAQQQAAVALVDQTVAAAAPYESLAAAEAAGYIPVTKSGQRIVHYINPSIYRSANALDPNAIPVLVYVNTSHGAVLSAAMYLMPRGGGTPPQPGGCLTQWHIHTDLCLSSGRVVGNDSTAACPSGSVNQVTQPMMHVWMTPVAGGPLAPDPPAVSEVLAAAKMPVLSQPNGTA